MSFANDKGRGSTAAQDASPPESLTIARPYIFAHLIPSSENARLAVEKARRCGSSYHTNFITETTYRGQVSTSCFEIALDNLPKHPDLGWSIGHGREEVADMGVDFLLCAADADKHNIAGIHARFSWVRDAGGFFLIVNNYRRKFCTVNGEDFSAFGERRPIPFRNTILIGDYPFTLRYVRRNQADDDRFQIELKRFFSDVLKDRNAFVIPTPQDQDARFGEWTVQCPLGRGAFGIVYMVIHGADGRRAAAKQLFRTKYNSRAFEREVQMATRVSHLKHKGILSPFTIRRIQCQTTAEIARIRNLITHDWNPGEQGNIVEEAIILSPLLHADLRTVISSETVSPLNRAIFFAKILSAVEFLHSKGLIHRDIKPANVLIETLHPPTPTLTDFGSASDEKHILYDAPGTITYLAPEQVEGRYHGFVVDEWACGLIGYELITRVRTRRRIATSSQLEEVHTYLKATDFDILVMPLCCRRLLSQDPEDRMSAGEAFDILKYRGGDELRLAIDTDDDEGAIVAGSKRTRLQ